MTPRSTDELVLRLAADAAATRLPSLWARCALWTIAAVACVAAGVAVYGLRPDAGRIFDEGTLLARALATLSAGVLAAATAFVLSVPGAERTSVQRALPLLAAVAWIVLPVVDLVRGGGTMMTLWHTSLHPSCGLRIAALAAAPMWLSYVMLRRAAPLSPGWSGALAALSASALAAVGVQFVCPLNSPAHLLMAHVPAVLLITLAGIAIGGHALAPPLSTRSRRPGL